MELKILTSRVQTPSLPLPRDGLDYYKCSQEGACLQYHLLKKFSRKQRRMKIKIGESEYPGRGSENRTMQAAICKSEGFTKKKKASTVPESMTSHLQGSSLWETFKMALKESTPTVRSVSIPLPSFFPSHKDVSIYQSCTPASIHWNKSKGPGTESHGFVLLINKQAPSIVD